MFFLRKNILYHQRNVFFVFSVIFYVYESINYHSRWKSEISEEDQGKPEFQEKQKRFEKDLLKIYQSIQPIVQKTEKDYTVEFTTMKKFLDSNYSTQPQKKKSNNRQKIRKQKS